MGKAFVPSNTLDNPMQYFYGSRYPIISVTPSNFTILVTSLSTFDLILQTNCRVKNDGIRLIANIRYYRFP